MNRKFAIVCCVLTVVVSATCFVSCGSNNSGNGSGTVKATLNVRGVQ